MILYLLPVNIAKSQNQNMEMLFNFDDLEPKAFSGFGTPCNCWSTLRNVNTVIMLYFQVDWYLVLRYLHTYVM